MKAMHLDAKILPARGDWSYGGRVVRLNKRRRCMSHHWRTARKKIRRLQR